MVVLVLFITAKRELNLVLQLSDGFATKLSWLMVLFVSERIDNQRKGGSLLPVIIQKLKEENIYFYSIGASKVEEIDDNLFQLGIIQDEETMAKVYNIADVLILPVAQASGTQIHRDL